jgi:MutS domain V
MRSTFPNIAAVNATRALGFLFRCARTGRMCATTQAVSFIEERCAPHRLEVERLTREHEARERRANLISLFRLATFLGAAITASIAFAQSKPALLTGALGLGFGFLVGVIAHARTLSQMHALAVRRAVHLRQLKRIAGNWGELAAPAGAALPADHAYACDVDLLGPGSLLQRIDVSQTREGEQALCLALAAAATPDVVRARQAAVEELLRNAAFREELETRAALHQARDEKLDHQPFMKLFARPSLFRAKPWLFPLMLVSVSLTSGLLAASWFDAVSSLWIWLCVLLQGLLLWSTSGPVHAALDLLTARLGFAKAYESLFQLIETQRWEAAHLQKLAGELQLHGLNASGHLRRLTRYEGFSQLRTQGPLYIVLNVLTLWDLFCLERIERFVSDVGPECERWFGVVGELEMLCSLATLRHVDPTTCYPELRGEGDRLAAQGLAHPLLPGATRVANDLALPGPGCVLIVTGSNMAGKSTLLRALGLNVALALAGGPVCAARMALPRVRLRASMRIDDSLQRGASYFHAELSRLRMVVSELDEGPPVLFLLDELLRGTNARARHQGARAVLLHLLKHRAMGVVATHDIALSELADELPERAHNVHFTDVFENGEMRFDYKLHEGVVKTSNALRLLSMAGIEVAVDDALR